MYIIRLDVKNFHIIYFKVDKTENSLIICIQLYRWIYNFAKKVHIDTYITFFIIPRKYVLHRLWGNAYDKNKKIAEETNNQCPECHFFTLPPRSGWDSVANCAWIAITCNVTFLTLCSVPWDQIPSITFQLAAVLMWRWACTTHHYRYTREVYQFTWTGLDS